MAEITYGGFTFTTAASGTLLINGGSIDGPLALTYVDEISPASFKSVASSPRVPESAKAAVIALGNNYQDISTQMQAANKAEYDAAHPPAPTQDTVANKFVGTDPNVAQSKATDPANQLNDSEKANLQGSNNKPGETGGTSNSDEGAVADKTKYGTDIRSAIQNQAGPGVTIGEVKITVDPSPDSKITYHGPFDNPLHDYSSYTYGLSLHMLSTDDYNKIIENQKYTPNRVIIASAGRYDGVETIDNGKSSTTGSFARAKYFDVDFYFENLNIRTVIGLNEHSRATNAVDLSFNIIEPYGVTLFNRILKLTNDINPDNENYLEQPYLLQIDFFGIDPTGEIVGIIPDQTKRIPIRILKFDIKVSNKGAEYSIQAAPYNHSAFDVASVSTPAHIEVVAGTVATFFQSNEADIAATKAQANQQRELQQSQTLRVNTSTYNGLSGGVIGPDGQITYVNTSQLSASSQAAAAAIATGDPIYRVKSYGSALNAWQLQATDTNKQDIADRYYFNFDPEIAKSDFNLNGKLGPKDTPMTDVGNTAAHRKGNTGIEMLAMDYKTKRFPINIGTSVEQVINFVIRNSTYITNQMIVPEEIGNDPTAYVNKREQFKDKPLKWYKIVPTIKLLKFDKIRKQWGREITYNVIPYEVYNTKISVAPQGTYNDPLKIYNYIYTGENVDVLDFNIEFNALYYTAVTAYRGYISATTGMPIDEEDKIKNPQTYDGVANAPNAIMPMKEKAQTYDARARASMGGDTPATAAAVDTEQSLYTTAGADMLQAALKIIGDPMYIKQDDIFYPPDIFGSTLGPMNSNNGDPRLIANGSLRMDNRELYIQVNYKTPSDIDESTGLMKFDDNYLQSLFSGMYKVLSVDSSFSGGQFVQSLQTVRLPRQASLDNGSKNSKETNQRNVDSKQSPGVAGIVPPAPIPSLLISGATGDQKAPNSAPVQDAAPPTTTVEQAKLAEVNNTADTKPISANTEPQAVPPPPAPPAPLPAGVTQDPVSGNYIYKGVQIPANRDGLAASMTAIDNNTTTSYNYVDPVSGTVQTRTIDGAALNAAYSPSGQLKSTAEAAQFNVDHVQKILASNPTAYGTVAQGQQVLAARQATADAAAAAYKASLPSGS